jgi:sugar lactone lactonase YvrE
MQMNRRLLLAIAVGTTTAVAVVLPQTQAPPAAGTAAPADGQAGSRGGAGGRAGAGGGANNAAFTEAMKDALSKLNAATGLAISNNGNGQVCWGAPHCDWGIGRNAIDHANRKPDMGFTYQYPLTLPANVPWAAVNAVAVNSKDHVFAYMRQPAGSGMPQLAEWDENGKFVRAWGVGIAVKAHGMAIDAQDHIWVTDQFGPTVTEYSPNGEPIKTIGVKGKSGVWDEAKGERILWQPVALAFAPNGDMYIGEGHGNESPNDGPARVLHFDRNGKFINQWVGNAAGPGKFGMVHGITVNPRNGDVYLGDREEYRIVVYSANGKFVKTIQSTNLVCALYTDRQGQLWQATGQDGQLYKLDWDGNVLGVAGLGSGRGTGQFVESTYMGMDSKGNLWVGDTSVGRVTKLVS